MSTIIKTIITVLSVTALGAAGYFIANNFFDARQNNALDTPENITADYQSLLAEAEELKAGAGANCDNKKDINKQIEALEKRLADLAARKQNWLDNVPELPEVEPEIIDTESPQGRPGSEVPELSSDAPPLPEISEDAIIVEERPGSEVPELTSDVPPLPEIDEMDIINPDEYIFQIENCAQKIANILQALKALCQEDEKAPVKKAVSDKCSDACQRHKDCAAYTEDATAADLNDAYATCIEECATWPKDIIKCINALDIKTPNDCISFLNCQLPKLYEERYLNQ